VAVDRNREMTRRFGDVARYANVDARSKRARAAPLRDREDLERAQRRAGREQRAVGVHRHDVTALRMHEARADDVRVVLERGSERVGRSERGARGDRGAQQQVVEATARQAADIDVGTHISAAGRVDANARRRAAVGEHVAPQTEAFERMQRVGDQRVAAHLVARERLTIDEQHVAALCGEDARRGGAGGTCADDQDVDDVASHRGPGRVARTPFE